MLALSLDQACSLDLAAFKSDLALPKDDAVSRSELGTLLLLLVLNVVLLHCTSQLLLLLLLLLLVALVMKP